MAEDFHRRQERFHFLLRHRPTSASPWHGNPGTSKRGARLKATTRRRPRTQPSVNNQVAFCTDCHPPLVHASGLVEIARLIGSDLLRVEQFTARPFAGLILWFRRLFAQGPEDRPKPLVGWRTVASVEGRAASSRGR